MHCGNYIKIKNHACHFQAFNLIARLGPNIYKHILFYFDVMKTFRSIFFGNSSVSSYKLIIKVIRYLLLTYVN